MNLLNGSRPKRIFFMMDVRYKLSMNLINVLDYFPGEVLVIKAVGNAWKR